MGEKQLAIREILAKIIKDTIQESMEPPIRTIIKSIQMIRDRLNELEASVVSVVADQGGKIDKLQDDITVLSETVKKLEGMLNKASESPKIAVTQQEKPGTEPDSIKPTSLEIPSSTQTSPETITVMEPKEKATKRKITEEKIKALFSKLEQVLPSTEEKLESESTMKDTSKSAAAKISTPEELGETEPERVKEDAMDILTPGIKEEKAPSVARSQETEIKSEEEIPTIPLVEGEELTTIEGSGSEPRTPLDDLTAEIGELEIQRSDLERKLGDLAFDRMRGLITEEEYRTKTQELRQNLEDISRKIDQIINKMRY
jgi:Mg2+ and Co2+ transporter CorA